MGASAESHRHCDATIGTQNKLTVHNLPTAGLIAFHPGQCSNRCRWCYVVRSLLTAQADSRVATCHINPSYLNLSLQTTCLAPVSRINAAATAVPCTTVSSHDAICACQIVTPHGTNSGMPSAALPVSGSSLTAVRMLVDHVVAGGRPRLPIALGR